MTSMSWRQANASIIDIINVRFDIAIVADSNVAAIIITSYDAHGCVQLYLTGKGDGNIRYFEMVDGDPYIYFLAEHRCVRSGERWTERAWAYIAMQSCPALAGLAGWLTSPDSRLSL